jgi:hypothetical protein
VFSRLLRMQPPLETYQALPSEDKIASQVHVQHEATVSLCYLHQTLGHASRLLKGHRQRLRHVKDPGSLSQTRVSGHLHPMRRPVSIPERWSQPSGGIVRSPFTPESRPGV